MNTNQPGQRHTNLYKQIHRHADTRQDRTWLIKVELQFVLFIACTVYVDSLYTYIICDTEKDNSVFTNIVKQISTTKM